MLLINQIAGFFKVQYLVKEAGDAILFVDVVGNALACLKYLDKSSAIL